MRGDSKTFRFRCGKSESLFKQRKNPRRIAWTVLYRRAHRKGAMQVRRQRLSKLISTLKGLLRQHIGMLNY